MLELPLKLWLMRYLLNEGVYDKNFEVRAENSLWSINFVIDMIQNLWAKCQNSFVVAFEELYNYKQVKQANVIKFG